MCRSTSPGDRSSGISAIAYPQLRAYLGLEPRPVRVYDIQQQLASWIDDILDRFDVDAVELGRAFALDDADWADWTLPTARRARYRSGHCLSVSITAG